jgi:DNA-binding NarL/FixJ family response regulator
MLCQECSKKLICKELCTEAEAYVDQDHVSQREKTIGLPKYSKFPVDQVSNIPLTKREKEILTLLGKGLCRADVCQLLNITRQQLRVHIANLKKKY